MCGVAGGWRDMWDDPEEHAQLAGSEAAERRQVAQVKRLGVVWQREMARQPTRKRRGGTGW